LHTILRYCNKKIKRYCDKKIFFSSKYCSYISKLFQINRKKNIFNSHSEKKYWLKNVFLYHNIAILCVRMSRVNKALKWLYDNFSVTFYLFLSTGKYIFQGQLSHHYKFAHERKAKQPWPCHACQKP